MTLPKAYEPSAVEEPIYQRWIDEGAFNAPADAARARYTIVIPPPNITGQLHMGHALNNTIQDILSRWNRMKGVNTLWLPGTDHAGIATQAVVERTLAKEGLQRRAMGREKFLEHVWAWREKYGNTIVGQLKKIGSSCDWSRLRFTLDEGLSRAVVKVFIGLYEKGLIYRGNYIVNWCPKDQTALSDEEVEHKDVGGKLWHVRYPGVDGAPDLVVATTRPETMLGDVAVAVHPDDERYKHLAGKKVRLPVVGRELPIVFDTFVDRAFGTGVVKITPAHDPNDFACGQRQGLTPLNVMNPDGTINAAGAPFTGMDRFKCRTALIEQLDAGGFLVKVEDHTHSVGHCYRCDTMIEPYLSLQWFVKMAPLAKPAIQAVRDGRVKFVPERWTKLYFDWMENIRDWCISRQLWWGHRIPAYYCQGCKDVAVGVAAPTRCGKCSGTTFEQDPDVLDTWFSSALWPFSTLGWPDKTQDLSVFYPTSTLVTDRGIIFFWVARMIMMGLECMGREPFTHVYIHGTILDKIGRKMSKSLGNGIDPLDVIKDYGADAMRFSLMLLSTGGQDIKLSTERFEMGRNFANKLWNASRFVLMNAAGDNGKQAPTADQAGQPSAGPVAGASGNAAAKGSGAGAAATDTSIPPVPTSTLAVEDRWILSLASTLTRQVDGALAAFDFHDATRALYEFTWHEYCDWYLEAIKGRLAQSPTDPSRQAALATAQTVLKTVLALLHPIMPYVTEEIWKHLPDCHGTLAVGSPPQWPSFDALDTDPAAEQSMERIKQLVVAVRTIKSEFASRDNKLTQATEVDCLLKASASGRWAPVVAHADMVKLLARVKSLTVDAAAVPPKGSAVEVVEDVEVYVPLAGLIDMEKEYERLAHDLASRRMTLAFVDKKLADPRFVQNAKPDVVEKERARRAELAAAIEKMEGRLKTLRAT